MVAADVVCAVNWMDLTGIGGDWEEVVEGGSHFAIAIQGEECTDVHDHSHSSRSRSVSLLVVLLLGIVWFCCRKGMLVVLFVWCVALCTLQSWMRTLLVLVFACLQKFVVLLVICLLVLFIFA